MKKYMTLDVVIGLILILFSGWFWFLSLAFPEAAQMFPQLFLTITFLLSVLLLVSSVAEQTKKIKKGENQKEISFVRQFALPCKAYCIMVLYVAGIRLIGFFVATTVFMAVFMYFLKVRKPLVLVCVTAGMDLFLYVMFCVGLKLSLPSGILF